MSTATQTERAQLVQGLGLPSSTTIVMGSMIGSGIFIVSADIARQVTSPGLLLAVWAMAAFMTVVGALSYGELAAAMPRAGGQYVYLRESLGPLFGFLYGWTLFLVIQTGTVAAVAVAFAKFLGVFLPGVSATHLLADFGTLHLFGRSVVLSVSTQQVVAILVIVALSVVNCFGLKVGALVQNVFTFTKTAALLGLVVLGYLLGKNAHAVEANFGDFWRGAALNLHTMRLVAVAMVGALFAADAWNNITFTAGEVKNARRNLPLSLLLGTGTVLALYLAANVVYLNVLPLEGARNAPTIMSRGIQYATEDRVGTAAAEVILGPSGEWIMAAFIIISTFGCANGLILAGARVYYAMARDGLFFRFAERIHPRYHSPVAALILQCLWASLLTLSGTYSQLLDYVIFAVLLFYILTISGLFVLRVKRPSLRPTAPRAGAAGAPLERPYRAAGYPLLPGAYILLAVFIEGALLRYKPEYTWPGLIIVVLGVPVYLALRKRLRIED